MLNHEEDSVREVDMEVMVRHKSPACQVEVKETYHAEVTGRSREGLLLKLETGADALAPLPEWSTLSVDSGVSVIVQVHSITDRLKIHCRLLNVLD